MLAATPEPWQREVLDKLGAGATRISIRSGHGVGKSALLAWVVIWFQATRYPAKIGTTAPTAHQLEDILWAEIGVWFKRMPPELQAEFNLTHLRMALASDPAGSFAVGRTARPEQPEALQGFHSENTLILVDEASGVPDAVFEVALGAMSTEHAITLLAGNPTRLSGYFYDTHHRLRDRWATFKVSSEDVPRARGHIDDIVARYGKPSNAYNVRVLGDFPSSEDDSVISLAMCQAAVERHEKKAILPVDTLAPIWGVDVARYGDDRSALAKRQANLLLEPVKSWRGLDTMQTASRVFEEYRNTDEHLKPRWIMVDVIGIGAGVVDRLKQLGAPVRGINVGESASSNERYMRLRDELWFKGREWLESGQSLMVRDDALIAELIEPKYTHTATEKVVVERKEDLKKRTGRSPDLADAFLLTLAGGDHRIAAPQERSRYSGRGKGGYSGGKGSWLTA